MERRSAFTSCFRSSQNSERILRGGIVKREGSGANTGLISDTYSDEGP
ncbi:MAG: hypothetical protein ACD_13C00044G0006 [uncultured bacterium]|nr:MAG: hypothetical protein ACD_13C00044G0006 [uncultured bacterium]